MKSEEPGKILFTVTTTGTAEEWESFREALDFVCQKSLNIPAPVYLFRNQITDLLAQARKIYWPAESESA